MHTPFTAINDHRPPRPSCTMNSPTVFVVTAIAPDKSARIFGTFSSLEQAEAALAKLAARLLLYRGWECRAWLAAA